MQWLGLDLRLFWRPLPFLNWGKIKESPAAANGSASQLPPSWPKPPYGYACPSRAERLASDHFLPSTEPRRGRCATMREVHKCQRALPGGGLLIINAKTRAKGVSVLADNLLEAVRGTSNTVQSIRRASKFGYIVPSYHLGRATVEG